MINPLTIDVEDYFNVSGFESNIRFEDLNCWKKAKVLVNQTYVLSRIGAFAKDYGLRDQIRRAAVSGMSNIAEGFERGSNAEFVQFLYIAKGSVGEVVSQLYVATEQGCLTKKEFDEIHNPEPRTLNSELATSHFILQKFDMIEHVFRI